MNAHPRSWPAILVGCVLVAAAAAQRRIIVDVAGGAGHHFTDLPPALASAQHGDLIELRAGSYRGATTSHGVTILGTNARLTSMLRVTALPLGRAFTMVGVAVDAYPYQQHAIECVDNAGRIHLDRLMVTGTPVGNWFPFPSAGLTITRCRAVTVTGGTYTGAPAIAVAVGDVTVVGATLTGRDARGTGTEFYSVAHPGLHAELAIVFVSRCRLQGGAAATHFTLPLAATPGLRAIDSDVVLGGGPGDLCTAGSPMMSVPGASAITGERGALLLDPTVPLVPTGGFPPISGSIMVTLQRVPALVATGAPIGQTVQADLYAPAGFAAASCLDLVREPTQTNRGLLWLDPTRCIFVDLGFVGSNEHRPVALAVPIQPSLTGLALALQSIVLDPVRGLALSNAAVIGVH